MTEQQREAVAISLVQLAATAVLAFNLAMNFIHSLIWIRAWKIVVVNTKISPIATGPQWGKFVAARSAVEVFVNPISLPLAAATTLFLLVPYKEFVEGLEKRLPLKRRFPVMNRVLALLTSCLSVNIGAIGIFTSAFLFAINKIYI